MGKERLVLLAVRVVRAEQASEQRNIAGPGTLLAVARVGILDESAARIWVSFRVRQASSNRIVALRVPRSRRQSCRRRS